MDAPVSAAVAAPAQAGHAALAPIPFKRDSGGAEAPLANGAAAVLVLSLIAIAAVLLVRKRLRFGLPAAGKPGLVKVLETQRLGPRTLLSVVEFGGARYLVAQGEHGVSCLASTPAGEQA